MFLYACKGTLKHTPHFSTWSWNAGWNKGLLDTPSFDTAFTYLIWFHLKENFNYTLLLLRYCRKVLWKKQTPIEFFCVTVYKRWASPHESRPLVYEVRRFWLLVILVAFEEAIFGWEQRVIINVLLHTLPLKDDIWPPPFIFNDTSVYINKDAVWWPLKLISEFL